MTETRRRAGLVKGLANRIGYVACGIAGVEPFGEFETALDERVARFPETIELYEPMRRRTDPQLSAPWARSIVVCVRHYGKYSIPARLDRHIGRNYLFDYRNPGCPDHTMDPAMLEGLEELGYKVQKAEVPMRWAAARAGVARMGRNTFAFAGCGSWINIRAWLVDAALAPDAPCPDTPCPTNCRACIKACPTGALVEPFVMRMDRCVAHLTYSAPHPVSADLWKRMGPWVYGCDECQNVCPLNRNAWQETERADWLEKDARLLAPEALATMDEDTYRNKVRKHFWYIAEEDLWRWHANAKRALTAAGRGRPNS